MKITFAFCDLPFSCRLPVVIMFFFQFHGSSKKIQLHRQTEVIRSNFLTQPGQSEQSIFHDQIYDCLQSKHVLPNRVNASLLTYC